MGAVRPGSLGARIGLQVGDVIVGLAGQPVRSDQDLAVRMRALRGQRVVLAYWRNGETRVAELAL